MATQLTTDYLIIGAGAVGLAFADQLLSETDAKLLIVDKHGMPGGHWNDAYPFVTLHQPSAFYGVGSKELSKGRIAKVGLNKGLNELATGAEVLSYFDDLMRDHFLPSGRVQYYPMCEYRGDGKFSALLSGQEYEVTVNKKVVDATFFGTSVPSTHTPGFDIAEDVAFCPLNDLPKLERGFQNYTVIGSGKTGIDAIIWLQENGVPNGQIHWIMPRDGWLLNRLNTQPSEEFFHHSIGGQAAQMEAIAQAESIENLFDRLEQANILLRIDPDVTPAMFHGATVSEAELEQLRQIKNVIRQGRVNAISNDQIVLERETISTPDNNLFIDCSASAVTVRPEAPVFADKLITIQTVRSFQPVFSAAFIAHIEASYEAEQQKNHLTRIVPLPNHDTDWLRCTAGQMTNQYIWSQEPGLKEWLVKNRLDGFSALMANVAEDDTEKLQIIGRLRGNAAAAMENLQRLVAQIPTEKLNQS